MPKYLKPIITLIFLAAIAIIAWRSHSLLWNSAATYRSPVASTIAPIEESSPSLSERAVLVIISGLGDFNQQSVSMPTLERLQQSGAKAVIQSDAPTYRQPAWRSLLSGAKPAINDAALLGDLKGQTRPIDIDSLFHIADRQGMKSLLVGHPVWLDLIPLDLLDTLSIISVGSTPEDTQFVASILDQLEDDSIKLMVAQFSIAEETAQAAGPYSEDYQAAIDIIDEELARLVSELDLNQTTLIITSDFGLTENGSHGGAEFEVSELPFAMVGRNVIPGNYSPVKQIDVAPTISALLGLPLPAINQGRPLLEMLQLPEQERAMILSTLAKQQQALTQSWLDSDDAEDATLDDVEAFLLAENYTGAAGLAELITKETTTARQQSILVQQNRARFPRVIIVGVIGLALLLFIYKDHSRLWVQALFSAAVVVATFHLLYRLTGHTYSLSAITSFEQTWMDTRQWMALSVAAGGLAFLMMLLLQQQNDGQVVLSATFEMFLFTTLGFLAPVLYGFIIIGPTITGLFPDVSVFFLYLSGQMQLFWAVALGVLLPPLIMLVFLTTQKLASLWKNEVSSKSNV